MFNSWKLKQKLRKEKINEAREAYVNFLEVSKSKGWAVYEEEVNKKIENIKKRMEDDHSLNGDDLKKLQLALQVWKQVLKIPDVLKENAQKGIVK